MKRLLLVVAAAAVMLAAFAVFFAVFQLPASGAPAPWLISDSLISQAPAGLPPHGWLMKADDVARVEAAGPVPSFQWVSCGGPQPDVLPCTTRGNTPTFTDYYKFRRWVLAGHHGWALADYEGWVSTPNWQRTHLNRYLHLTCALAAAHGVRVIAAPVTTASTVPRDMTTADEDAARAGCDVVSIQHQAMTAHPKSYATYLAGAVPRIRAAGPGVIVMVNLAADAGGHPVTAATLTSAYNHVRGWADAIWLNASLWTVAKGGTGCAPQGCPLVVLAFLQKIGA